MNQITRIVRKRPSEDHDDVADVHAKFQAAIAQIQSLYELYAEWPGIEKRYEALAAECDNARIEDEGRYTVADIVADDLAELADDRRHAAAHDRQDAARKEVV